ncbi:efflux RND transporter periplasmic adaptor subunit [uncultured Endozoicomonas sp.]|uniref:efflux RND transporter periplasmic adaptor subunit n=1 Tax=uncultured Endozoicomonas sp. TaxID=432652 RepID=UPI00261933A0|nr:efflux RND transporter periplasmic adaptor subunit [uncultured Endozoicomonas sp.]
MQKFAKLSGSWLAAGGVSAVIAVYLLTADVVDINDSDRSPPPSALENPNYALPTVEATRFDQTLIKRTLTLYGRTETDRTVTVSSELAARVVQVSGKRGELITVGQEILKLNEGSLKAQLASAKARVKQVQQDYDSVISLQKKKLIADNQVADLEASLAEAISNKEQLRIHWENTKVVAPISGVLNQRYVEVGDFIDTGKPVAEILDLDPLVISVDVPQASIAQFQAGESASVRFADGQSRQAYIRFISRQANSSTRTFEVELTVENPAMDIPAGLSVEADLFMDEVLALEISPAWLALDEDGKPGVKWVNHKDRVQFTPIDLVKSESNRLWITGIPRHAKVITRGQGFVRAGDQVSVINPGLSLVAGE